MRLATLSENYPVHVICSWCQKDMGIKMVDVAPTDDVFDDVKGEWLSHAMCPECYEVQLKQLGLVDQT